MNVIQPLEGKIDTISVLNEIGVCHVMPREWVVACLACCGDEGDEYPNKKKNPFRTLIFNHSNKIRKDDCRCPNVNNKQRG